MTIYKILSHISPFIKTLQILRFEYCPRPHCNFNYISINLALKLQRSDESVICSFLCTQTVGLLPHHHNRVTHVFFFFFLHVASTRLKGGIIHRSLQNFSLFHPLVSKERATSGALCKVVSHSLQQRKTCASVFIISQTHLLAAQCCSSYWYHYS